MKRLGSVGDRVGDRVTARVILVTFLPLRTISTLNAREHWRVRARRSKAQRSTTRLLVRARIRWPMVYATANGLPAVVTLTRIAPRELDGDNLQGALKAVRDGVADALGVDDGSPLLEWRYGQRKGKAREYGVLVSVDSRARSFSPENSGEPGSESAIEAMGRVLP